MINKVILVGNLGRDPEMRFTQDGRGVANLRIATSERWTDRNTNERQERTEWHTVVCFARLAEICSEYLHKGSRVYIEGRLQTRQWEDRDGNQRYTTEVVAREMKMLDRRGESEGFGRGQSGGYGGDNYGGQGGDFDGGGGRNDSYGDQGGGFDNGGYGGGQRSAPPSRAPRQRGPQPASAPPQSPAAEDDDFDDDIPF